MENEAKNKTNKKAADSQNASGQMLNVAKSTGQSFISGFSALKKVYEAARQTSEAKTRLSKLQGELEAKRKDFSHRVEIANNYPSIYQNNTAELNATQTDIKSALRRIEDTQQHINALQEELTQLKADNENKITPYRELMESTRGRSDESAKILAENRRSVKAAENQVNEMIKNRDQRIASANRTVDSAQNRLRKVQSELDRLQRSPHSSISALSKIRSEVAAEHAHLDAAKQDVVAISATAQKSVDDAQEHLWTQQQSLQEAQTQADATKKDANAKKEEYDTLYKKFKAAEDELAKQIKDWDQKLKEDTTKSNDAKARAAKLQKLLDEAYEIHAHPQITQELKEEIAQKQKELSLCEQSVSKLSAYERNLREVTRKQRAIFIIAAVFIAILIIALLYFLLFLFQTG